MLSPAPEPGKIITFYAYKGGTGRTMALANVAVLLARRLSKSSGRVLMIDWDLEAPGLHRFFSAKSDLPRFQNQPGVINYFLSLREKLSTNPRLCDQLVTSEGWQILGRILPLDDYLIPDVTSGVDFMRAGRFDFEYPKLVSSFNWIEFFQRYGAAIRAFRELLSYSYTYTLVDSRTGVTDVSGICTSLLPEKLVAVFTPNRQSLHGLRDIVRQAIEYRSRSDDFRPLSVFPLPSRVENAEKDLREQWHKDYQSQFEELFHGLHQTDRCDLTEYFKEVLLPHVSYYAYGENIAVLQERSDAISLGAAYERFFDRLIDSDFAWQVSEPETTTVAAAAAGKPFPIGDKYDAFLSYVEADGKVVGQVKLDLQELGVRTFFDRHDVLPGEDWAASLSAAMLESKAIIVFVGPSGGGPWQNQESLATIESYARNVSRRVIPVLLPGAPSTENLRLPTFLRNVAWVDLRAGLRDREAMGNLVWALTGKRPARLVSRLRRWVIGFEVAILLSLVSYYGLTRGGTSHLWSMGPIGWGSFLVRLFPDDGDAHLKLAEALANSGRTDEALSQFREVYRLKAMPNTYRDFVLLLDMDRTKAVAWLRDTMKSAPDNERLHFELSLLLEDDDQAGAIQELREAIRINGKDPTYHHNLAVLLEKRGDVQDLQQALLEYRSAIELGDVRQDSIEGVKRLKQKLNQAPSSAK